MSLRARAFLTTTEFARICREMLRRIDEEMESS
jgi:hypothetical protein